ncbi:Uncharacterized protein TCM_042575 [Theobroma cacao]|uniref:Uncharacterized protein n=1 Tax=Theobroma cacao TaxID=3641 RepID=A0A061FL98_THECC|nr:Uncharacterized protein TCM_042575 [Theobroma cacao]
MTSGSLNTQNHAVTKLQVQQKNPRKNKARTHQRLKSRPILGVEPFPYQESRSYNSSRPTTQTATTKR